MILKGSFLKFLCFYIIGENFQKWKKTWKKTWKKESIRDIGERFFHIAYTWSKIIFWSVDHFPNQNFGEEILIFSSLRGKNQEKPSHPLNVILFIVHSKSTIHTHTHPPPSDMLPPNMRSCHSKLEPLAVSMLSSHTI